MEIKTYENCFFYDLPRNQTPCDTCDLLRECEASKRKTVNESVASEPNEEYIAAEYRPERYTTPDGEDGYVLRSNGVFIHGPAIERFAAFENIGWEPADLRRLTELFEKISKQQASKMNTASRQSAVDNDG